MGFTIAGRSPDLIARTITDKAHRRGLRSAMRTYVNPTAVLGRYASARGNYPYSAKVMVAGQVLDIPCYSWHDLVTVHEVFARGDYLVPGVERPRTLLDVGANIGIVSLWALASNADAEVYCVEPVPLNVNRLKSLLEPFVGRWHVTEAAADTKAGVVSFGVETTGRYGGIDAQTGTQIEVPAVSLLDCIDECLERWGFIDLLKIDVEGHEIALLETLDAKRLSRINALAIEHEGALPPQSIPASFSHRAYLDIHQLSRIGPIAPDARLHPLRLPFPVDHRRG